MFRHTRYFRHRAAVGAAVACCLAGPELLGQAYTPRTPGDDEIDRPAVREVKFRGVRAVDGGELRDAIATRASGCKSLILRPICLVYKGPAVFQREYLDRLEFKRDVLRIKVFYWRRGFRDAQVDTSIVRKDDEVRVRFTVHEGPPTTIAELRIEGADSVLPPRRRRRLLQVGPGEPLDLLALDSTIVLLRNRLAGRGYADAVVTQRATVDDSLRRARIVISVDPKARATVGQVTIVGEGKVSEEVIRHSLRFEPGDVYRPGDVAQSQRALYESGLFRRATIDVGSGAPSKIRADTVASSGDGGPLAASAKAAVALASARPDSVKNITILVEEAPLREARTSVGFNTVDFAQAELRFTNFNWMGDARRLELQGVVGNILAPQLHDVAVFNRAFTVAGSERAIFLKPTWQVSADVRQRWFRNPRNTIGAGVFANRRSAPGIYIDRSYGTSATFTREILPQVPVSGTYRFEVTQVEAGDVYFCINFGVCETVTVDALRRRQHLSPFTIATTIDRSNHPVGPTRGYVGRVELEHASAATLSTFRYNRAYAEAAAYRPMGRRNVLAGHVRIGWVGALASTAEATKVGESAAERILIHPRKQFYAGGARSVRGYAENQLGPRVLTIPADELRGREIASISADGRDTTFNYKYCDPATTPDIRACDPNVDGLADRHFQPRPLGAGSVVEGSAEFRFPVWRDVSGAVFLDGAVLGAVSLSDITAVRSSTTSGITAALTPGFGFRYRSPIGPIRMDIGINPRLSERLSVITEDENDRGLVLLSRPPGDTTNVKAKREYNPAKGTGLSGFFNRLTLHLSIGEAY
jgi:outer membrane protein assembly factor BamA